MIDKWIFDIRTPDNITWSVYQNDNGFYADCGNVDDIRDAMTLCAIVKKVIE